MADRIFPLIDVAAGEVENVARAAFGSAAVIVETAALEGGLTHTPLRVRLEDGSQWVFRFCAGKLERFERERRLLTELRTRLPVPELAGSRGNDRPVLVLRWVDGIPLWQLRREHPEQLLALAALIDWDEPFDGPSAWDVGHLFRYPKRFSAEFVSAFESAHRRAGGRLPEGWWQTSRLLDAMRFIETLDKPAEMPAVFDELRELLEWLDDKKG